ncbi:hypothetical protein KL930_002581 [Ogataea haglerorum]|nr:hypothetical protein KL951_002704 [Ogataea haglerorum]KAG7709676.1 hypothetical protein KL950_001895 [Ogataea haglerorum]KAG7778494.1 hypothetical protein KL930_002581 [Ogataea haglerorum]KAG7779180.1 hypothetical protein KL922_001665 [Ogataea haglerorum]
MYSALVTEAYDWEECQRAMNSYSFPKPEDSPQKSRRSSSQFNTPQTPTIQESDSESDEKTLQRADVSPRQHAGSRKKLKYDKYEQPRTVLLASSFGELSLRPHQKHQSLPRRSSASDCCSPGSPRQHRRSLSRTGAAIQDDLASVLGRSSISLRSPVSSAQSSPKSEPAMTEECLCSPLLKEERSRMDSFSFGARPQCDSLPRELIDLDKVAHYS